MSAAERPSTKVRGFAPNLGNGLWVLGYQKYQSRLLHPGSGPKIKERISKTIQLKKWGAKPPTLRNGFRGPRGRSNAPNVRCPTPNTNIKLPSPKPPSVSGRQPCRFVVASCFGTAKHTSVRGRQQYRGGKRIIYIYILCLRMQLHM